MALNVASTAPEVFAEALCSMLFIERVTSAVLTFPDSADTLRDFKLIISVASV